MVNEIACIVLVALTWGATNPLIKYGTRRIKRIKERNPFKRFYLEVKYLLTNMKYIIPMVMNQIGSLIYFLTLQNMELSIAAPLTNSLTFVVTAITGWILGETFPGRSTLFGIFLIFAGSYLCFVDKLRVK